MLLTYKLVIATLFTISFPLLSSASQTERAPASVIPLSIWESVFPLLLHCNDSEYIYSGYKPTGLNEGIVFYYYKPVEEKLEQLAFRCSGRTWLEDGVPVEQPIAFSPPGLKCSREMSVLVDDRLFFVYECSLYSVYLSEPTGEPPFVNSVEMPCAAISNLVDCEGELYVLGEDWKERGYESECLELIAESQLSRRLYGKPDYYYMSKYLDSYYIYNGEGMNELLMYDLQGGVSMCFHLRELVWPGEVNLLKDHSLQSVRIESRDDVDLWGPFHNVDPWTLLLWCKSDLLLVELLGERITYLNLGPFRFIRETYFDDGVITVVSIDEMPTMEKRNVTFSVYQFELELAEY